jgi:transcriptional regulator with XRE-family HTH domain
MAAKKTTHRDYAPARRRAFLTSGQALKTIRELQGMTQKQLGAATGIEQAAISTLEHDRMTIGPERAKKLARALDVHPAVLVFPNWEADTSSSDRPVRGARRAPSTTRGAA